MTSTSSQHSTIDSSSAHTDAHLSELIAHAAHLLPTQGPISVFVHHNTLHAFEDLPFEDAVVQGARTFGCEPYLFEEQYRQLHETGRIRTEDLTAVLIDDLGETHDDLVGFMGTRYELRAAMLALPLQSGTDADIDWHIAETGVLDRFRDGTPESLKNQSISATQRWIMRDLRDNPESHETLRPLVGDLLEQLGEHSIESWSERKWESFTLQLLWRICIRGVQGVPAFGHRRPGGARHRDLLLDAVGFDSDSAVDEVMVRFCSAFLDQGYAHWPLPGRDLGFFRSFIQIYGAGTTIEGFLSGLPAELKRLRQEKITPLHSIRESLEMLGVSDNEQAHYIQETLLALRGWAGMVWQLETNAEWTVHPAPKGTLIEYLAVRLIVERVVLQYWSRQLFQGDVSRLRSFLQKPKSAPAGPSELSRAFMIFQLAQVRGWCPNELRRLSSAEWSRLLREVESFSEVERRRVFHLAYERQYRHRTLDAVLEHCRRLSASSHSQESRQARPAYQVICCIDDREESFRRHLEEVDPECQTFGMAGFFGVAMYYRGVSEAHYRPLCPVVIKPTHYVREEPTYSLQESSQRRALARRAFGQAVYQVHRGSRSVIGGILTGLLGSVATIPLLLRVLAPRLTARTRRLIGDTVTPPVTQLCLERLAPEPGPKPDQLGYTISEMVEIVRGSLRALGLTKTFSDLVIVTGHGASSLNNPHSAAYDCGACGGGRGGPNARSFAVMANDPRVRSRLQEIGLSIPENVHFLGAYHNTSDDSMTYFDLDLLPRTHRPLFERAKRSLGSARQRNAHERCRRFVSAELSMNSEQSLRHVEGRAEDLSQTRPECGHATNALCFVGKRSWSRGLFLDRRAFLTSYDSKQDDDQATILTNILRAVIPVCAGINLEYYFSYVDRRGYGCGTKLPHNVTGLIGVMDGAASDLRPGLPWQMVEIHEPVRLLFLIETTPDLMNGIIDANPPIAQLVRNEWVQLAVIDPMVPDVHVYRNGQFEPYVSESDELPIVQTSSEWYRGQRDHLGFATISSLGRSPRPVRQEPRT